jgi:Domain of unknown function (DUF4394)
MRIIKAIGATLAVVAAMATPAAAQGPTFGFDFNPTVDKIRVTSVAGGNDTVDVTGLDNVSLASDRNLNPGTPQIVGSAYTN